MRQKEDAEREGPSTARVRKAGRSGRFGLCLALSLALHAALIALLPSPFGAPPGTELDSAVYVRMLAASPGDPNPLDNRAEQAERSSFPARSGPPDGVSRPETPSPPEAAADTGEGALGYVGPDSAAAPGKAAAGTAAAVNAASEERTGAGEVRGAAGASPEDRAAALLLARVEAKLRYPEAARRRGTEGVTGLRIRLDEGGGLADLRVIRSSGSALLDRAAREAVEASLPVLNPSGRPLAFELAVRFSLAVKTAAP